MHFTYLGHFYQPVIENRQDLQEVLTLDEALWCASCAPICDFHCDPQFLRFLSENHSHITAKGIKNAIQWLLSVLQENAPLPQDCSPILPLSSINPDGPSGKALLTTAQYILKELSYAPDTQQICIEDIRAFIQNVKGRPLNGDGVISKNCIALTQSPLIPDFLKDVIAITGGAIGYDGTTGVTLTQVQTVLSAIPGYLEWLQKGELNDTPENKVLLPLREKTAEAYAIYKKNAIRIQQFFDYSDLLSFDSESNEKFCNNPAAVRDLNPPSSEKIQTYLQGLPLARTTSPAMLPTNPDKINPSDREWWKSFYQTILIPLCGNKLFYTRGDWNSIQESFQPYADYQQQKVGALLEKVSIEQLRLYQNNSQIEKICTNLVQRDLKVTEILRHTEELEKLLLYRSYLITFSNNFVNFSHLYYTQEQALFEQGDILLDGRWFHLVFPVTDLTAHSSTAMKSNLFILYLEAEISATEKRLFATPVTSGNTSNLMVGKRGIFRNLQKEEYIVKIVQMIENPINLKEALSAPFSKFWKQAETKIEQWSSNKEKGFQNSMNQVLSTPENTANSAKKTDDDNAAKTARSTNTFMSASIGFAALGSAVAFISKTLSGMTAVSIWLTLLGAFLALAVPLSLLALLKLKRQNISLLLEGNGWAINAQMKLNPLLRKKFTEFGTYPKNSTGTPKRRVASTIVIIILLAAVAWIAQKIYLFL